MHKLFPEANSLDTAEVASEYPYGRLICDMYFYVEYRKGKGWRGVTQSRNPKTGLMNKPHPGTYSELPMYVGLNPENNHLEFVSMRYFDHEKAQEIYTKYWEQIPPADQNYIIAYWSVQFRLSPSYYAGKKMVFPNGLEVKGKDVE